MKLPDDDDTLDIDDDKVFVPKIDGETEENEVDVLDDHSELLDEDAAKIEKDIQKIQIGFEVLVRAPLRMLGGCVEAIFNTLGDGMAAILKQVYIMAGRWILAIQYIGEGVYGVPKHSLEALGGRFLGMPRWMQALVITLLLLISMVSINYLMGVFYVSSLSNLEIVFLAQIVSAIGGLVTVISAIYEHVIS